MLYGAQKWTLLSNYTRRMDAFEKWTGRVFEEKRGKGRTRMERFDSINKETMYPRTIKLTN